MSRNFAASLLRFPIIACLIITCLIAVLEAVVLCIPAILSFFLSDSDDWPAWWFSWTRLLYRISQKLETRAKKLNASESNSIFKK